MDAIKTKRIKFGNMDEMDNIITMNNKKRDHVNETNGMEYTTMMQLNLTI